MRTDRRIGDQAGLARGIDAFAHRGAPPSAPPQKPGMSGCAIVAIIGAVALVFGVFIAGILAAIAIFATVSVARYVSKQDKREEPS